MYKKKLWKPIMAGTLALTMFVTPLSTVATVSAAVLMPEADTADGDIPLDAAHFPDANFRSWISANVDSNHDDTLSKAERDARTRMVINGEEIADLTGIEYFTELMQLYCMGNSLTTLDVSGNSELTHLNCANNELTTLNVSTNPDLVVLYCNSNSLTTLDVSGNPELNILHCYSNSLTTLDVSGNPELMELYCHSNGLTTLDVSGNPELTKLNCGKNGLTTLGVSGNPELTELNCGENGLTTLNVSGNPELTHLNCANNELTMLNVSTNPDLVVLYCNSNSLTTLDVSENPELNILHCYSNSLTTLDVSGNPELTELYCNRNSLTTLNVSGNPELTELYCNRNSLTTLDVSGNPELTELYCSRNSLTTLNVSGNPELTILDCDENHLTALNVSTGTELTELRCESNYLTTLDVSGNPELTKLYCAGNSLTTLDVNENPELTELRCGGNQLTSLDVSANPLLSTFSCNDNGYYAQLNELRQYDVSSLPSFDTSKVSGMTGGTLSGTVLTFHDDSGVVVYTYDCGNGKSARFAIMKKEMVTRIVLNQTRTTLLKGDTLQLTATVTPSDATDKTVEWTSSNDAIAAVSKDGLVTAKANGTATITCAARDGSGVVGTCVVTVKTLATKVTLNKTATSVLKGRSLQLKATITPSDASDKSVTWITSDSRVATVSSSGKVTAKAVGTATITCIAKDGSGVNATCEVKVTNPVTKIKLNKRQAILSPKDTLQLKETLTPSNASNRAVTWKSSNTKVATVSSSGKVTAKATGTATITCTAKDGSGVKATCTVTVYTNTESFVVRIYENSLGRPADTDGLNYWTEEINSGRRTPVQVAEYMLSIPEFTNRNLSDVEYVKVLYRTFMGREYDQGGLDYWLSRLAKGESRKSVLESFAGCQEFKDIVKSFGL